MKGLVLSIFPGLDLLGRAFKSEGWCVVRGPDLVWAHDIRGWHVPAGHFDGVIGGPPCQCFSRLRNLARAQGHEPRFGNLIPEFERVVSEASPTWWLMEEVVEAPAPAVAGYHCESILLSPRDLGNPQSRNRRFTVGRHLHGWRPPMRLVQRLPYVALENVDHEPAVVGQGGKHLVGKGFKGEGYSWSVCRESLRVQGYPELGDILQRDGAFTAKAACQLVGNGVPHVMGEAFAKAIGEWWSER